MDADIRENPSIYGIASAAPNIDFRRVVNLNVFFSRNAETITTSLDNPQDWQAGDIVVFWHHTAICSDKRNSSGIPYIIHHGNAVEGAVEADHMERYEIIGHYRWN